MIKTKILLTFRVGLLNCKTFVCFVLWIIKLTLTGNKMLNQHYQRVITVDTEQEDKKVL